MLIMPNFEVVSIERTEPPANTEGAHWYKYVISVDGRNTIRGCRKGSLKEVTSDVEIIVSKLNERNARKRKT